MKLGIIVVALTFLTYAPARATDANTERSPSKTVPEVVAKQIERLASPSEAERSVAVDALVKIGPSAAPAVVKALENPSNDARAAAAKAVRSILAADPMAAPNRHERNSAKHASPS